MKPEVPREGGQHGKGGPTMNVVQLLRRNDVNQQGQPPGASRLVRLHSGGLTVFAQADANALQQHWQGTW